MRWFRFYTEAAQDGKVQRLSAVMFRHWVNILSLANEGKPRGRLPGMEDIAFWLHVPLSRAERIVGELVERGLLDEIDGRLVPHNWDERQPEGGIEGTTSRVQAYRQRLKAAGAGGLIDSDTRAKVFRRDGKACVYCGSAKNLVIDHLVPLVRGGSNYLDNLVPACRRCNSGKAGRTPEEAGYTIANETVTARLQASRDVTPVTLPEESRREENRGEESRTEAEAAATSSVLSLLTIGYENEIGSLSPGMTDSLKDWAERIPNNGNGEAAIQYAFGEAVANNTRRWRYVESILGRLEAERWPADPGSHHQGGGEPDRNLEHEGVHRRYELAGKPCPFCYVPEDEPEEAGVEGAEE